MTFTRESLLKAAARRKVEAVAVPGGVVHARGLSSAEWDEYEAACAVEKGDRVSYRVNRAVLFRLAACDEHGKPLFAAADDAAIRDFPRDLVEPVCAAANRLSGATKKAEDDAGKASPAP